MEAFSIGVGAVSVGLVRRTSNIDFEAMAGELTNSSFVVIGVELSAGVGANDAFRVDLRTASDGLVIKMVSIDFDETAGE